MRRVVGWGTRLAPLAALACGDPCVKSEQTLPGDDTAGFVLQFEGTATPADALSAFAFDVDEEGAVGTQTLYRDFCKERDTIGVTAPLTTVDGRGVRGAGELSFPSVSQPGTLSVTTWLPAAEDEAWLRGEAEAAVGPLGPLDGVDLVFHWPDGVLRIVATFEAAGELRQVGPDEVPAFEAPYDFTSDGIDTGA